MVLFSIVEWIVLYRYSKEGDREEEKKEIKKKKKRNERCGQPLKKKGWEVNFTKNI